MSLDTYTQGAQMHLRDFAGVIKTNSYRDQSVAWLQIGHIDVYATKAGPGEDALEKLAEDLEWILECVRQKQTDERHAFLTESEEKAEAEAEMTLYIEQEIQDHLDEPWPTWRAPTNY
jgi:hypothetical protein